MKNLETKTENKFEGLYIIGYGLAGGFGGARTFEVIQVDSQEEADKWAWENACDEYDRYAGSNGLREVGEIMQEDGIEDEDEALQAYEEERESWLDYSAKPYSKEYEKKVMYNNHYHNPYKEITGDCGN
jgi:hypothetical protein